MRSFVYTFFQPEYGFIYYVTHTGLKLPCYLNVIKQSSFLFFLFYYDFWTMLSMFIILRTSRCVAYFCGTWICHNLKGTISKGNNTFFSKSQFLLGCFIVSPWSLIDSSKHANHHQNTFYGKVENNLCKT